MGKKMPFETAEKLAKRSNNTSVFAPQNKYGYKININHPIIRPLYEKCKSKLNIMIMSDQQRHDFETIILRKIENGEIKAK